MKAPLLPFITVGQTIILESIIQERDRQERLKAEGKFAFSCADDTFVYQGISVRVGEADKYVVLGEEFGEVGRAILNAQSFSTDYKDSDKLEQELIQLAAVAIAWLESIQRSKVTF